MIRRLYHIYDKKAETYRFPNFFDKEGQAIRMFESALRDSKTEIGNYPTDFELYEIGIFEDDTGEFIPNKKPRFIMNGTIKEENHAE